MNAEESNSSPLIPILIAILVLAAISATVLYVRRRQRPDDSAEAPSSVKAS